MLGQLSEELIALRAENELLRAIQGLGISQRSGGLTPSYPKWLCDLSGASRPCSWENARPLPSSFPRLVYPWMASPLPQFYVPQLSPTSWFSGKRVDVIARKLTCFISRGSHGSHPSCPSGIRKEVSFNYVMTFSHVFYLLLNQYSAVLMILSHYNLQEVVHRKAFKKLMAWKIRLFRFSFAWRVKVIFLVAIEKHKGVWRICVFCSTKLNCTV